MGKDLALVTGSTAQMIGRNACKELWTREELKVHMLSPKAKQQKQGTPVRTDFSPVRKELLKGSVDRFFSLNRKEICSFSLGDIIF